MFMDIFYHITIKVNLSENRGGHLPVELMRFQAYVRRMRMQFMKYGSDSVFCFLFWFPQFMQKKNYLK